MLAKKMGHKVPSSQLIKKALEQGVPSEGHNSTFGRQGAVDGRHSNVEGSGFDELEDSPLKEMLEQQQEQL